MDQSQKQMITRSKAQKITNINKDTIKLEKTQERKRSSNIKTDFEISIKERSKRESYTAKKTSDKSEKKKGTRRKLKFVGKPETVDEYIIQKRLNTSPNELKVKTELEDAIKNKNSINIKKEIFNENNIGYISSNMITPKSTSPKISLTHHTFKKTPRKSPIFLDSPKTHRETVPKLLKSPRKLSLSILFGSESTKKSSKKIRKKTLEKAEHGNSIELSPSNKDLSILAIKKNQQKSDINVKSTVRKVSKHPKIVLNPRKSKKSRSLSKLRLSPSHQKHSSMIATPNILDLNDTKSSSTFLYRNKSLSLTKRRFLNSKIMKLLTASQVRDVLAEPIVLLEKLPKNILNIPIINGIKLNTSIKIKSPLLNKRNSLKMFSSTNSHMKLNQSVDENSSFKLKHNRTKNSNKMSLKSKDSTLIQKKDKSTPLMSSTPQKEEIPLLKIDLVNNSPIQSLTNISLNTRSSRMNTSSSDIIDKNTVIANISKPSLIDNSISSDRQSYFSNSLIQYKLAQSQMSYDENNAVLLKEQENEKNNTYELEQPQTLNLRQMLRKCTSPDANLITPKMNKKTKVHFANATFDTNSARKLIEWTASQSSTPHNNAQRNSIMNSSCKSKQIKTSKSHRNSVISTLERKSSSTVKNKATNMQLNMTQSTPKTSGSISKKTGRILFFNLFVYVFILSLYIFL